MSIAIATTSSTATPQSTSTPATLQAQLDRCNKQLSDWVNCSSGKTPEGKQIIAALQAKISDIKHQIQQGQTQDGGAATPSQSVSPPASLAVASLGTVGTILNTLA